MQLWFLYCSHHAATEREDGPHIGRLLWVPALPEPTRTKSQAQVSLQQLARGFLKRQRQKKRKQDPPPWVEGGRRGEADTPRTQQQQQITY